MGKLQLLLFLACLAALSIAAIFEVTNPHIEFDATNWDVADDSERWPMAEDLIRNHLDFGISKKEITTKLGMPNHTVNRENTPKLHGGPRIRWRNDTAKTAISYWIGNYLHDDAYVVIQLDSNDNLINAAIDGY